MTTPAISVLCVTRTAGATLAANRFVKPDGTYPAAGGAALGVTRTSAELGAPIPVDVLGTTPVEAGGPVAIGPVMVDATGRVVTHTGVNVKAGIAFNVATASGQTVEVFLIPNA